MFFIWWCDLNFVCLGIICHDLTSISNIHLEQGILLNTIIVKVREANLVANRQL